MFVSRLALLKKKNIVCSVHNEITAAILKFRFICKFQFILQAFTVLFFFSYFFLFVCLFFAWHCLLPDTCLIFCVHHASTLKNTNDKQRMKKICFWFSFLLYLFFFLSLIGGQYKFAMLHCLWQNKKKISRQMHYCWADNQIKFNKYFIVSLWIALNCFNLNLLLLELL